MTQIQPVVKELVHIRKVLENLSLAIQGEFRYNDADKRAGPALALLNIALHPLWEERQQEVIEYEKPEERHPLAGGRGHDGRHRGPAGQHPKDTRWLVGVAMMAAIVVLLANTPLGLINIWPIKATTIHIPVIVGAILFGPMAGGILGGVFGICSIISNTVSPVAASICFSPVLAVSVGGPLSAVKALWISLGCRILIGVVAGWLWILLKKLRANDMIALPVVGFIGSMTNTVTVMGSIFLMFRAEYAAANNMAVSAVFDFIIVTVTGAGVMEAVVALVLVTAIGKALLRVNRVRTLPA